MSDERPTKQELEEWRRYVETHEPTDDRIVISVLLDALSSMRERAEKAEVERDQARAHDAAIETMLTAVQEEVRDLRMDVSIRDGALDEQTRRTTIAERERDEARRDLARAVEDESERVTYLAQQDVASAEAERDAAREEAAGLRVQLKRWEDKEVARARALETALRGLEYRDEPGRFCDHAADHAGAALAPPPDTGATRTKP